MNYTTSVEGVLGESLQDYARRFVAADEKFENDINAAIESFKANGYADDEITVDRTIEIDGEGNGFRAEKMFDGNYRVDITAFVRTPHVSKKVYWYKTNTPLASPDYSRERNEAGAKVLAIMKEHNVAVFAEKERLKAVREKADAEARERSKASEAAREKKRLDWIKEHGSERLQLGVEQGHKCIKLYTLERFKHEIAEAVGSADAYVLDYDGDVETKDRSCPSLEALQEVKKLKESGLIAEVVWLPKGLSGLLDEPDYEDCEGCEAIEVEHPDLSGYMYRGL